MAASASAQATAGILILSDAEIRAAVGPTEAVESQREAYRAVAAGSERLSGSTSAVDQDVDGLVFALTGAIGSGGGTDGALSGGGNPVRTPITCKFGYQAPGNAVLGLPTVHAFVTLLDPDTGVPLACLNGTTITTMRTAAGLAAAADAVSLPNAGRLTILGSGVQAQETARMIAAVRTLQQIRIWSPSGRRNRLAETMQDELSVPDVAAADSAEQAVSGADLIACCTSSRDPILRGDWVAPGATVLTMGSYQPDRREIDRECTRRAATVLVDEHAKATENCGPLLEAFAAGDLTPPEVSEIGRVLIGEHPGRGAPDDIVVFHSVGIGVQDATLACLSLERAAAKGLGTRVEF